MRRASNCTILLLASIVQAMELAANDNSHKHDSLQNVVDKLLDRAVKSWLLHRNVDDMALAKPGHLCGSGNALRNMPPLLLPGASVPVARDPFRIFRSSLPISCSPGFILHPLHIFHARREVQQVRATKAATATEPAPAAVVHFKKQDELSVKSAQGKAADWSGDALILMLWGSPKCPLVKGGAKPNSTEPKEENVHSSQAFKTVISILSDDALAIDSALGGAVKELVAAEEFKADAGSSVSVRLMGQSVKHLVLVGLGPKVDSNTESSAEGEAPDWRQAGAAASEAVGGKLKGSGSAAIVGLEHAKVQPLMEGFLLGLHKDVRFKGKLTPDEEKLSKGPSSLELFLDDGISNNDLEAEVAAAMSVASAVIFARELVNAPPNVLTPPALAEAARVMGSQLGLETKIFDESDCDNMGMGAFLAVGRASNLNSKLIHLAYKPEGKVTRRVGIVGKGLTYDSGGYNIKPSAGGMMELMKFDMGGSAATLGAAAAIAQLKPKNVEVHFVVATCENMISGNDGALRPGDIIKAMDGTTIEVENTDAEGRLTLADAILYAQEQGVTELVDVATLTGACMVALGTEVSGMWSNNDALAKNLQVASDEAGEKIWRMPLEQSYAKGLKSDLADIKNLAGRFGGAITAALFLEKFVDKSVSWAHIDIAGTVWATEPKPICAKGGRGELVRTLTNFASKA